MHIVRTAREVIADYGETRANFNAHYDLRNDTALPQERTQDLLPALSERDRRDLQTMRSPYYSGDNLDQAIHEAWLGQGYIPLEPE